MCVLLCVCVREREREREREIVSKTLRPEVISFYFSEEQFGAATKNRNLFTLYF